MESVASCVHAENKLSGISPLNWLYPILIVVNKVQPDNWLGKVPLNWLLLAQNCRSLIILPKLAGNSPES